MADRRRDVLIVLAVASIVRDLRHAPADERRPSPSTMAGMVVAGADRADDVRRAAAAGCARRDAGSRRGDGTASTPVPAAARGTRSGRVRPRRGDARRRRFCQQPRGQADHRHRLHVALPGRHRSGPRRDRLLRRRRATGPHPFVRSGGRGGGRISRGNMAADRGSCADRNVAGGDEFHSDDRGVERDSASTSPPIPTPTDCPVWRRRAGLSPHRPSSPAPGRARRFHCPSTTFQCASTPP